MSDNIRLLESKLGMTSDTEKVSIHNSLSELYMFRDVSKMYQHVSQALRLSKQFELLDEQATAYYHLGCYYYLNNNYKLSIENFKQALLLCPSHAIKIKACIYNRIGVYYAFIHNFEKATTYIEKAIELVSGTDHYHMICRAYISMGRVHRYLEEYDIADYYYREAARIAEAYKLLDMMPDTKLVITHNDLRTFKLNVEKNLLNIESYMEDHDDLWYLGPTKVLWATYYLLSDAKDVATINYKMALDILEEENQFTVLVATYDILTFALEYKGYEDEALNLLFRAEAYFTNHDYIFGLPKLYLALSKFYSKQGKIKLYQQYLRKYVLLKEELDGYLNQYF